MAAKTIELPNWVRLRTATQRRYLVLWTRDAQCHIELRTDDLGKARKLRAQYPGVSDDEGRKVEWFIVDVLLGRAI